MTTSVRRRDAVANRQALLDAAARVLRERPQASMDLIAADAGLTRRAVYGHFPSRDALLGELLDRGAARISSAIADIRDDDPARHMARLARAIWLAIADVKLVAQMLVSGPLEKAVGRAVAPIRRALRDVVGRGCADGSFRQDVVAAVIARLIEQAALGVLDVAVERGISDEDAQRLLGATALGIAGLDWHDARVALDAVSPPHTNGDAE